MRHAIMVMGFGNNSSVLQQTINVLDDYNIDFFVHWDKRYKIPKLISKKSKIIFTPRIKVRWATDTQTLAEIILMKNVINNDKNYNYVHLISDSDIPLMTSNYFQKFFKPDTAYLGFVDYLEDFKKKRLKYYYPIRYFNIKKNLRADIILKLCVLFGKIFKINRLQGIHIEHGCNWFSMDVKYIKNIIDYPYFNIFKNTFSSDEFFVQTILQYLKPKGLDNKYNYYSDNYRMTNSSRMATRYIDWYRGSPYNFNYSDVNELKNHKNTRYAFARKVNNPNLVKRIFSD